MGTVHVCASVNTNGILNYIYNGTFVLSVERYYIYDQYLLPSPSPLDLCPLMVMLLWMTRITLSLMTQSGPGLSTRPFHNLTHPPAAKYSLLRSGSV